MIEPSAAKHRPAPLRLRALVFPKMSVGAVVQEGAADPTPPSLDLETVQNAFKYRLDHEAKVVPVGMRICSLPLPDGATNKDRFYEVDVEAFAIFELVGAERQDEIVEYLRKVAAASALLGAIREQISMSTARGPWGVLTIPLISMDAIVGRPPARTPPPTKVEGKKAAVSAAPKLSRKHTNKA